MAFAGSEPALILPLRQALNGLSAGYGPVGIAVSGGADSAMLAVHAALVARERGLALRLLHVHHGLFEEADAWARQVERLGQMLETPVSVLHVQVSAASGSGVEAAARQARYQALGESARDLQLQRMLLAHHRDDQAETVMLRLLRGAGPAGLAAMAFSVQREGLIYLRPWLDVPRVLIRKTADAYREATGWAAVHDPSNADIRYTRAALRELLAPALEARWPGWQAVLARHARLANEAAEILDELARSDLACLEPDDNGHAFSLAAWRRLSPPRQAQVLRHWLAGQGARMPTEARLAELLKQLRGVHGLGHDRQLVWNHGRHCVRCVRGRVTIETRPRA